jgi:hypothetical protein
METIHLFKPYPDTLALALICPVLLKMGRDKVHGETPEVHSIPKSFQTPYGYYKYVNVSKLGLIPVICVKETGVIFSTQIRAIYIEHILIDLADRLKLDFDSFFKTLTEGKRTIITGVEGMDPPRLMYMTPQEALESISSSQPKKSLTPKVIGDMDLSLYSISEEWNPLKTTGGEYYFSYWTTTTDPQTLFDMTSLEITVRTCFDNNLSTLPTETGWGSNFLKPILTHIREKLVER